MERDRVKATLIKFFLEHNKNQLSLLDEILDQYGDAPDSHVALFSDLEDAYTVDSNNPVRVFPVSSAEAKLILAEHDRQQHPPPHAAAASSPFASPVKQSPDFASPGGGGGGGGGWIGGQQYHQQQQRDSNFQQQQQLKELFFGSDDDGDGNIDDPMHERPHPAEIHLRQNQQGDSFVTIPSSGAASIVIAARGGGLAKTNSITQHAGTFVPLENALILEEQRQRALENARSEALSMVKAANARAKTLRANDPMRATMMDPGSGDINSYYAQKSLSDETLARMSATAQSLSQMNPDVSSLLPSSSSPLRQQYDARNMTLTPDAIRAAAAAAASSSNARSLNPATSTLAGSWSVLMASAPPSKALQGARSGPLPMPRPFTTQPGELLPARRVGNSIIGGLPVNQSTQQHIGGAHPGHPSLQASAGHNTIQSVSSKAWSRPASESMASSYGGVGGGGGLAINDAQPSSNNSNGITLFPAAADEKLVVPHSAPLNTATTTTTILFERDRAAATANAAAPRAK